MMQPRRSPPWDAWRGRAAPPLGAAAFLHEPLDPDALRDALRAAIAPASADGPSA